MDRRRGEGSADRAEVPEEAALPGGPWAGPEGAEGDPGETGPLHFPARAGPNPTHGSMSLRMLGTSCLIIPSLCH